MNHPVLSALLPVVLLIATGFFAGKRQWIAKHAVKDITNLVFFVLMPSLLFRTMSSVHFEKLDLKPVGIYFLTVALVFAGVLFWHGLNRRSIVVALGSCFSNIVMIGIPLATLAYGEKALVYLFTLVSLHALVLLSVATLVLEFAVLRESAGKAHADSFSQVSKNALLAVRHAIIHPVPLPIIVGLVFAQTGLVIPAVVDKPLQLLGSAFSPMALLLVGITLAHTHVGAHLKSAFGIAVVKNILHPVLMAALGTALGLSGMPLAMMVFAAAMPVGANVLLFSQRYQVAQELIPASIAVTAVTAFFTLPLVMAWIGSL